MGSRFQHWDTGWFWGGMTENKDAPSGETLLPTSPDEIRPMKEIQQHYAQRAWELYQHNYTAAAQALGIQANTLRYTYLKSEGKE
jgi:DNA-binding NtrC family response regulator